MRIAVTTQAIAEFRERNTPEFGMAIIPLLPRSFPEARFILLDENSLFPELDFELVKYYTDPGADVYFDISTYDYNERTPRVATVLDFTGSLALGKRWWHQLFPKKDWIETGIEKAEVIVVTHQAMKQALIDCYQVLPAKIEVVGHGLPQKIITPADPVTRRITKEVYGKEHSYFFAPALGHPSDNLERLFAAYDLFRARCPEPVRLLVQLPEFGRKHSRAVRKARKQAKHSADIVFLPQLSAHEHRNVFSSARAILYPSLSTAFPLPVLDAWTAEVPVLYTDNNILQGGGALVQGEDVKSIAEGMVALVTTPFLASGLVENGKRRLSDFSWDRVAERVAEVLRAVAGRT